MLNESDLSRIGNALWVLNVYKSDMINFVSRRSKFHKDDLTEETVQAAFEILFMCKEEIYKNHETVSILSNLY